MARVLIVGCGCRGRALANALVADGHAVRGTTRSQERLTEIEASGAQAALADPDRLTTLLPQIDGASAVCWLMGSAVGEPQSIAAIHGPRLQSLLERLVDTPVRGFVYEAAGEAPAHLLDQGTAIARAASRTYRIPVEIVERDAADHAAWLAAMRSAVGRLLTGERLRTAG